MRVLADPVRQINQRGKGGQIEHLVRHRVGVAAQAGGDLELAGEVAVKEIGDRRQDHRRERHHKPELRQRMAAEDADRQEKEDQRHPHQRQGLDEVELQPPRRAHCIAHGVPALPGCRRLRCVRRSTGRHLALQDGAHPFLVVEIPAHGLADALLELVGGQPAQLLLDLRRVNGVAAVVARAVLDEGDQLARIAAELRGHFVDQIADQLHDVEVGPFVVAADVVGLAGAPARQHQPQRFRVVADVEPVAHVHAVAIDGDRFARQHALNHHRDQLLRELIRPVVVRAIGDHRLQAVGVMIGAHEHVAGGLAGRVRRVRRVGRGLGEEAGRAQAAIDFVGGDVVEAVAGARGLPRRAAGFQQVEGADDIGVHEIAGAGDRAVHVRLGRQVHDVGDAVPLHDVEDGGLVPQVHLLEDILGMLRHAREVLEAPGVGQAIEAPRWPARTAGRSRPSPGCRS